ncbi:alpha/beta fold hydrolase [Luteococcus sp.]|uniref:alpha/beta fold hydrolase n=1 Tax=Luteococcus sp. TaxID=1969402 RepID=UPI003735C36C
MEHVTLLSGITLAVEHFGERFDGVPLVVLHGGPSWSHHYLNPGLRSVGEQRHVVAPDLRGCGDSSRDLPLGQYQPELAVQDVIDLIGLMGFEQVDLLGFSTGGQWVQLLVERRPELVRRLVLASTTAYVDFDDALKAWPEYRRRRDLPGVMPETGDDLHRTIAWAHNDAPRAIWNLDRLDEYRDFLNGTTFSGDWLAPFEQGLLHSHRPADPEAVLTAFGRPVLILHARQDMGFPLVVAQRLHSKVSNSQLVVLEDCGHQAPFESPAAWSEAILDFLAG